MESFIKKVILGKSDEDCHNYFKRYGKGVYQRRFILKITKTNKIKINTSFEFANDLARFANEQKSLKFSGKIFMKNPVAGMSGRKKGVLVVYEVTDAGLDNFKEAYFYLLNVVDSEIVLKTKQSLPKPGKDASKIDDKFCSLELDLKYWPAVRDIFFWDIPECKKAVITHELRINEIIFPQNEKDPVKIRALAKRKGVIVRKAEIDGKEISKEYGFEV